MVGRIAGGLCQFSFTLSVFSASYPNCAGDAGDFIGPYSLSLVNHKYISDQPHKFLSSAQWIVLSFLKVHACVKPKAYFVNWCTHSFPAISV